MSELYGGGIFKEIQIPGLHYKQAVRYKLAVHIRKCAIYKPRMGSCNKGAKEDLEENKYNKG